MPSLSKVRLAGRCDCSTSWMISAFSDAGYLMPRPPHPRSCFFKQAVLQGEIGHHLLQGGGFTTKVLHLAGRRGAGGVARQPALARLPELPPPAVIHPGGGAFPPAQLRDVLLATQSFRHNADLLFGRILLPRRPADVADKLLGRTSGGNGFLSHLRSLAATMSQKSSVPQATKFVSQALKQDTPAKNTWGSVWTSTP